MRTLRTRIAGLDRDLLARVARSRSPLLDLVLPRLGSAADHSRLWMAVAAGLGASGRHDARRAAVRGLGGVTLASVTANLLTKSAARRSRPPLDDTPLARRLRRVPTSGSFPSGHAASAAAFAVGAALEMPALAVPLGALAAAVGASRVVTGVHYPSDVLAGAAMGAGAAGLTLWWWPRRDDGPAEAAQPRHEAPTSPRGEGLVVVVNGAAGSADGELADRLRRELPDAEVVESEDGEDVPTLFAEAVRRARVLGVAGGDGTVRTAAAAAVRAGLPLLVLPGGTLNHFARDVGVATVDDALDALRVGDAVAVDVAWAGEGLFLNTSSVGVYVDLVRTRTRLEKRIGKWPAVAVGLSQVLRRSQPQELVVDGRRRRLWLAFAGNGRYEPEGFAPSGRSRLDDGALDVRIVDAEKPFARLRLMVAVLTGTLGRCRVYQAYRAERLTLESADGPVRLSLDGELTDAGRRVVLAKEPARLVVYRPAA